MRYILTAILLFLSYLSYSQSTLPLRADTVLIERTGGSGELKIKNSTRDTLGILVNIGGGRTRFMKVIKLNDSTLVFPPSDTVSIGGGISTVDIVQLSDSTWKIGTSDTLKVPTYYNTNRSLAGINRIVDFENTGQARWNNVGNWLMFGTRHGHASNDTRVQIYHSGTTGYLQELYLGDADEGIILRTAKSPGQNIAIRLDTISGISFDGVSNDYNGSSDSALYYDPATGEIKYGPKSTGSGGSTVESDTTITGDGSGSSPLAVNKRYLANVYSIDTTSLYPYGSYFTDQTFAGTLASMNYTATGLTATVGSGRVNLTNGNNDYLRRLYKNNTLVGTQYWKDTASITINNTPGATTYGVGIGRDGGPLVGWVDLTNTGTAGRVYLNFGATELANSGGTVLSFSNGDTLIMVLEQRNDSIFFSARNKTTASATITVSYKYLFVYPQTVTMSSGGAHGVYLKGGDYYVNNFTAQITSQKHPTLMGVIDSKGEGLYAGSTESRFLQQLNDNYTPVVNYSNSGAATSDFLGRINEILAQNPKQVILGLGSNDIRQGVAGATWRARYRAIVDSLHAHGVKVYHIVIWEQQQDLTVIHNFLDSLYHNDYISAVWTATSACGSACVVGDQVHPNQRGNDSVYAALVRDGRILRGNYRLNVNYVSLDSVGRNTTNVAAKVLNNNNGRIEESSLDFLLSSALSPYIKQNGNAFAAPVQIGSTDNQDVRILRNGVALSRFLAYPFYIGFYDLSGDAVGSFRFDSLRNTTIGSQNFTGFNGTDITSIGHGAGSANTTGDFNTYAGVNAGAANTTGNRNTASGYNAMPVNTGSFNVGIGSFSLGAGAVSNTVDQSTAVGDGNLYGLTTGDNNSGLGFGSGQNLTTGSRSIIIGSQLAFRSATEDGQINVGGLFWGKNATATGSSAAGLAGIANNNPAVTLHIGGTDAVGINGGTSAQRPTGAAGYIRWNTDSVRFEYYTGSKWVTLVPGDQPFLANPMTTALDLIYGGASGTPTRLAGGSAFQLLGINSAATAFDYKSVSAGTGMSITQMDGSLTFAINSAYAASGSWTPTTTLVTNADAATVNEGRYKKFNNDYTVSLSITVDPTAAGIVEVGLSPVVASTFSTAYKVNCTATTEVNIVGTVTADTANNRLKLRYTSPDGSPITFTISGMYLHTNL